ncbi:MAG: hypothetical protein AAGF12_25245, partial [Myxococcota bacterium]
MAVPCPRRPASVPPHGVTSVRWLSFALGWSLAACSSEERATESVPEAVVESTTLEPLEREPASRESTSPDEPSTKPTIALAGSAQCEMAEPERIDVLETPIESLGAYVVGDKGVLALVRTRGTLLLQPVHGGGGPADSPVERPIAGIGSILGVHLLEGETFAVVGRGPDRLIVAPFTGPGRTLGEPRIIDAFRGSYGRVSYASHGAGKRLIIVSSYREHCHFAIRRFRLVEGEFRVGPVRAPAKLWPSCDAIVDHRVLENTDPAAVLFIARDHRGTSPLLAVANEPTRFMRFHEGQVRAAAVEGDQLLMLSREQDSFVF